MEVPGPKFRSTSNDDLYRAKNLSLADFRCEEFVGTCQWTVELPDFQCVGEMSGQNEILSKAEDVADKVGC